MKNIKLHKYNWQILSMLFGLALTPFSPCCQAKPPALSTTCFLISGGIFDGISEALGLSNPEKEKRMNEKMEIINQKDKQIAELDQKINKGLEMKDDLESMRKELFQLKERMHLAAEVLGNRPNADLLAKNLENMASQCGLRVEKIQPLPERSQGFYGEIPLSIKVYGNYHEFGYYFDKIANEARIMNISDLNIIGRSNEKQKYSSSMDCILTACYHIEQDARISPRMPLPPFLYYWVYMSESELDETIKEKDEVIRRKEKAVQELQIIIDQVLKYEHDRDILQNRLNTIETLKKNQSGPVRLLDEINRRIPENVWLSQLQTAGNLVTIRGFSLTQVGIGDFMGAMDASPYFSNVRLKISTLRQNKGRATYEFELDFQFTV
ncbi:type 4a pilus biogenesis protein PilO [bacterium]|nr:type 4a pilus biogenesis protein PilO [candidate division CSSED10-310 bacterium]